MRRRKSFQERFQLCLGFYPHGDIHGFSIPEEQERGNGGNLIALCQFRGFVYVDFSKGNFRMLFRQFFHHGESMEQGPHQAAQKSSSTGAEDRVT